MREQMARLAEAGIQPVEALSLEHYVVFARDRFAALVEHRHDRFVRIGTSGVVMEGGLAMLMWRDGSAWLVTKAAERPASPEEVSGLRQFSAELMAALKLLQ